MMVRWMCGMSLRDRKHSEHLVIQSVADYYFNFLLVLHLPLLNKPPQSRMQLCTSSYKKILFSAVL